MRLESLGGGLLRPIRSPRGASHWKACVTRTNTAREVVLHSNAGLLG